MKIKFIILFLILSGSAYSQITYVPVEDNIYNFFKRMQVMGVIPEYNSSNLPVSREDAADLLKEISGKKRILTSSDLKLLNFYTTAYEFELTGRLTNSTSLLTDRNFKNLFSDKNKYLFSYADSNAAIFLNGSGMLSGRFSRGDSLGDNNLLLGNFGFTLRGSLFNSAGFYLYAENNAVLSGALNSTERRFLRYTDKIAFTDSKFSRNAPYFSYFEGYLRYRPEKKWMSFSIGRFPVALGSGYMDRLFLSTNTVPFDMIKLDLSYKAFAYTFIYGALKGDSLGRNLSSKNIASHRLNVNITDRIRLGLYESVVTVDAPFNLSFLNPVSFLTIAELNKSSQGDDFDINNGLMGMDIEYSPVNNISLQASLLIDDLDFSKLFGKNSQQFNKFGYQAGVYWTNPFNQKNFDLIAEYTRIDPFVYSHKSNKTNYLHHDLPLGHDLPPNSDEIAIGLRYYYGSLLNVSVNYQFQRSAHGIILDSAGDIIVNYGGDIDNGIRRGVPEFLNGNRVNRNIFNLNLTYQPIRNYFFDLNYTFKTFNNIFEGRKLNDNYLFATVRVVI